MPSNNSTHRFVLPMSRGFTLIELMIVVAVVAILAAIAIPSYAAYIFRSRVPPGLNALTTLATRMEQRYQDTGNYGTAACSVPVSTVPNFSVTCVLTLTGQGFTATATGSGSLVGATYNIDHTGARRTVAHPKGVPATACWTLGGVKCDA